MISDLEFNERNVFADIKFCCCVFGYEVLL